MEQYLAALLAVPEEQRAFGCLSCVAGRENSVIRRIQERESTVRAFAAAKEKHKTVEGVHSRIPDVMLPGYVFFQAPVNFDPFTSFRLPSVNRVLSVEKNQWQLQGSDLDFTRWLFEHDGMLRFSKAYRIGTRVHFASGPLKDLESTVRRVDWRGNSAEVEIRFDEHKFKVWLGFDRVDPPAIVEPDARYA